MDHEPTTVLNCWKDISLYVGNGVRTVQRWERAWGFPVRRMQQGRKSTVLAIPAEIDAWVQAQRFADGQLNPAQSERTALLKNLKEVQLQNTKLRADNRELHRLLAARPEKADPGSSGQGHGPDYGRPAHNGTTVEMQQDHHAAEQVS